MVWISAVVVLHVAMGATWTIGTLVLAIARSARRAWCRLLLGIAVVNMLAGIDLWRALHSGPWGATEHLLVVGTFLAFVALGLQLPVVLSLPKAPHRIEGAPLAIIRATALILIAAAAFMAGSMRA